jgi:hypothetical protein
VLTPDQAVDAYIAMWNAADGPAHMTDNVFGKWTLVFTALETGPGAAPEYGPTCGRYSIVARLARARISDAGCPPLPAHT